MPHRTLSLLALMTLLPLAAPARADDCPGRAPVAPQPAGSATPPGGYESPSSSLNPAPTSSANPATATGTMARETYPVSARLDAEPAADFAWIRYEGRDLRFEQPRFGGEARLFVRDTAGDGSWRLYRGDDLDTILTTHRLTTHAELPALRARIGGGGTLRTVVEGEGGLRYEMDPSGRDARLILRADDGERVWIGSDLDAIVRDNPDLARRSGVSALQTRVREVQPTMTSLRLAPTASTQATVTYAPAGVTLTTNEWRDRTWTERTYEGRTMEEILQREKDLQKTFQNGMKPSSTTQATSSERENGAVRGSDDAANGAGSTGTPTPPSSGNLPEPPGSGSGYGR